MKILHVVPSYKPAYVYGGPIESVARLCETLQAAGHAVTVFTTTANGDGELAVTPNRPMLVDAVEVTYFRRITKDPTHISPRLWWALYKRCPEFDLVHVHSWWNVLVIVATLICHWRKATVVLSPRGMLSEYIITTSHSRIKQWIHRLIGQSALRKTVFHATSDLEYAECQRVIPGWTGFLLPNILQLPTDPPIGVKSNVFTLLFLSRIHPKKGLELLFKALSRVDEDLRLKIAGKGDDEYISQLKQVATQLNVSHKIDWLGWRDRGNKFTELANADAFVLTSFNENFANVVIESLSVGTPVILSDKVGLSEYIIQNNLGWVTNLDADSVAATIRLAMQETEKRAFIRAHGREQILHNFSEVVLAKQYTQYYRRAIAHENTVTN